MCVCMSLCVYVCACMHRKKKKRREKEKSRSRLLYILLPWCKFSKALKEYIKFCFAYLKYSNKKKNSLLISAQDKGSFHLRRLRISSGTPPFPTHPWKLATLDIKNPEAAVCSLHRGWALPLRLAMLLHAARLDFGEQFKTLLILAFFFLPLQCNFNFSVYYK